MKNLLAILFLLAALALSVKAPPFIFFVSSGTTSSQLLLLDELAQEQSITNGMILAAPGLSLRKLSTNYTGYCLRVFTNSVDGGMDWSTGPTLDVGFDSNNIVDVEAIATYSNGENVYVVRIYDQGTNDNANSSMGQPALDVIHPLIAIGGTVISNGGFPAIATTNESRAFSYSTLEDTFKTEDDGMGSFNFPAAHMLSWVGEVTVASGDQILLYGNRTLWYGNHSLESGFWGAYLYATVMSSYAATDRRLGLAVVRGYADVDLYTDGNTVENKTNGIDYFSNSNGGLEMFGTENFGGSQYWVGYWQETIRYRNTNSNPQTIKSNTNAKLGIY